MDAEDKRKQLEFIQEVINRHNSNSFMIKGWAVTITAAIFALTGTIKDPYLAFVAVGPIIMLWILDSIFLANERCFVSLYSCALNDNKLSIRNKHLLLKHRLKRTNDEGKETISPNEKKELTVTDYSMNFTIFRQLRRNNWYSVVVSYTIVWFYAALLVLTFLVFLGITTLNTSTKPETINVNTTLKSDTLKTETINESSPIKKIYINDTRTVIDLK